MPVSLSKKVQTTYQKIMQHWRKFRLFFKILGEHIVFDRNALEQANKYI